VISQISLKCELEYTSEVVMAFPLCGVTGGSAICISSLVGVVLEAWLASEAASGKGKAKATPF
jgi:hypothetical protein